MLKDFTVIVEGLPIHIRYVDPEKYPYLGEEVQKTTAVYEIEAWWKDKQGGLRNVGGSAEIDRELFNKHPQIVYDAVMRKVDQVVEHIRKADITFPPINFDFPQAIQDGDIVKGIDV